MPHSNKARSPTIQGARRALAVLVVYWLVLFAATHGPVPPRLPTVRNSDKAAHLVAYAVFAFLLARSVALRRRLTPMIFAAMFLALILYGAVDELLQPLTGRHAEIGDWVADGAGTLLGLVGFRLLVSARGTG